MIDDSRIPAVGPPGARSLAMVRDAALRELRAAPRARPWRRQALMVEGVVIGVTVASAVVVAVVNAPVLPLVVSRLPAMVLLLLAQMTGLWAALSPRRSWMEPLSWALAAGGAALVLLTRGAPAWDDAGWLCSISHVAAALVPLVVVRSALRDGAFSWRRGITAGLALGSAAAFWGEVSCQRSMVHALTHHFGAWLVLAAVCVLMFRAARPRSHAP